MKFSTWYEQTERDSWEQIFLSAWRLRKENGGLSLSVVGLDPNAISQTSAYKNLSVNQQTLITNNINQGKGTVGDLVDIATTRV